MEHDLLPKQGPKEVVRGKRAVCSSPNPIITETMLEVMQNGGNAVDAAVAGSLLAPVVEPHMSTHGGSISFLFWEAKTGQAYQLNSTGTLVPGLPPFRPLPGDLGGYVLPPPAKPPQACIPGFMPGLAAMHERFGSRPWPELCQAAIEWAERGHPVTSFELTVLNEYFSCNVYFPSGRELFAPNGYPPSVGELFKNPKLAQTLQRLADEGPQFFTTGEWAQHFVQEANRLGWPIRLEHMTAIAPRWQEPLRYQHTGYEILQLAPPEIAGVFTAFTLGVLHRLEPSPHGHFTETAQGAYFMAHTLRRVAWELGLLNDPQIFETPTTTWLSDAYQQSVADILRSSRPAIDLTEHVRLEAGLPATAALGLPPAGSCELSVADADGNWVQSINTVQTGGIPGAVIDGVATWGSHAFATMGQGLAGWNTGGGRIRCLFGNTIVLQDGRPWMALGSPGHPNLVVPQVLWSVLHTGMDPYDAIAAPRLWPLRDDYNLVVEGRLSAPVITELARLGIHVRLLPGYEWHLGSVQMCWRDETTGLLNSSADPRRAGMAGGF